MVEFALIAPFFFFLLFSLLEFGRAVYYIQMLNNAAREGARYAIVHGAEAPCPSGPLPVGFGPNPCDPVGANVKKAVKDNAFAIIDAGPADFVVSVKWCASAACPGALGDGTNERNQTVSVSITYVYRPIIAGFTPIPTFTLTGGSTLVVNH
jgi:TadE-like protein